MDTFRIFAINSSGNLTLNETTVSGAATVVSFPGGRGGGVYNRGTLTLTRSTVSGNRAGSGGGVFNRGTLTLNHSTVSGNSARFDGGGVFNGHNTTTSINSTAILTNSTVSGNSAGDSGGGVLNGYRGIATLTHSTLSGNSAVNNGGGVGNLRRGRATLSTATLSRTVVSGNTATATAPAGSEIFNNGFDSITATGFNLFGQSGDTNAEAFVNFTPGVSDITATTDGTVPTPLAGIYTRRARPERRPDRHPCARPRQPGHRRGHRHLSPARHRPARGGSAARGGLRHWGL